MQFLLDVRRHGLLPVHEIVERGEIPAEWFLTALIGRLAQDSAECFDDADPIREHLLSIAFRAEDWFEAQAA
jgi:hypothetical protein